MLVGAPFYVQAIGNPGALPAMYFLAPAILFSCLMAIYRGYYEGLSNMYPTALSEIIEAVCKLLLGLSGAYLVVQWGLEEFAASGTVFGQPVSSLEYAQSAVLPAAAAAAILGVTVGSLLSYLFLLIRHRIKGDGITREELAASPSETPFPEVVKKLIRTAIPIGIGALAVNVAGLVDTTFLQTRIRDVMETNPDLLLGMYDGMIPQVNIAAGDGAKLPVWLLFPGADPVYGGSGDYSGIRHQRASQCDGRLDGRQPPGAQAKHGIRAADYLPVLYPRRAGDEYAFGAAGRLIFGARASLPITSRVLVLMGIGAVFASVSTPINSMLQAVGRVDIPVKLLGIGLAIKVGLNYVLTGIPEINILGAGAGTLVCYAFITVFGVILLCRVTKITPNFLSVFIKPAGSALVCCTAAYLSQHFLARVLPDTVSTLLALGVAFVTYVLALLLCRALTKTDILMLPKGQKIAKLLEKHGWIR